MRLISRVSSCVGIFLVLGPFSAAESVITDGFESGAIDPSIWTPFGSHTSVDTNNPHNGSWCLALRGADGDGSESGLETIRRNDGARTAFRSTSRGAISA